MSAFAKRLERVVGPPMAISAVDARKLKPPFKQEICLQRVLMIDADGLGPVINAAVHCELAPVLVGGVEAVRLLLGTADLIRDFLAQPFSPELVREMREALQRINGLAASITAAKDVAAAEHEAFHEAEAKTKGPIQ